MYKRQVIFNIFLSAIALPVVIALSAISPVRADFGDADFPLDTFKYSPKSYHDSFCRTKKNKCRVRFQQNGMWVEGQGGIFRNQFITYRHDTEWKAYRNPIHYNYISYKSKDNIRREALFIFIDEKAQRSFTSALLRWLEEETLPIPNYPYPYNQGPQETQGRDNNLNPYENPPIKDWSIKSDKKGMRGNVNCDSPVWKNKTRCN